MSHPGSLIVVSYVRLPAAHICFHQALAVTSTCSSKQVSAVCSAALLDYASGLAR
jgi:hypothetical protein